MDEDHRKTQAVREIRDGAEDLKRNDFAAKFPSNLKNRVVLYPAAKGDFERARSLAQALAGYDAALFELPLSVLQSIQDAVKTLAARPKNLASAQNSETEKWVSQLEHICNQVVLDYGNIYSAAMPALHLLREEILSKERLHSEIEEVFGPKRAEMQQLISDTHAAKAALDEYLKRTGIAAHARAFRDEALRFRCMGYWWLSLTALLAIATAVGLGFALYYAYVNPLPKDNWAQFAQLAITKLAILSFFVSATVWCGRLYRSAKHNETVNFYRTRALQTYKVFVRSEKEDPEVRQAVLSQVTACIYTPSPTGLVSEDREEGVTLQQLIDVVKAAKGD